MAKEKAKFTSMLPIFSGFTLPKRAIQSIKASTLPMETEMTTRNILLLLLIINSFIEGAKIK